MFITTSTYKAFPNHLSRAGPQPASHLLLLELFLWSAFVLGLCAFAAGPGLGGASQVSCCEVDTYFYLKV